MRIFSKGSSFVVAALCSFLVLVPTASARTWLKERPTPARFGFATKVYDDDSRCTSSFQLVVTPVAGAKSYRAAYWDGYWKRVETKSGPPFEHLLGDVLPSSKPELWTDTTWDVTGGSGPVPCASMSDYLPRFPQAPKAWALMEYEDAPDKVVGVVQATGKSSKPVAGVKIRLTGPSGPQTVVTDRNGAYSFVLDERGAHRVTAAGKRICLYTATSVVTNFPCVRAKAIDARGGSVHRVAFSKLTGFLVSGRVYCPVIASWSHESPAETYVTLPVRTRIPMKVGYKQVRVDPATGRYAAELEGGRTYRVAYAHHQNLMDFIGLPTEPAERIITVRDRDIAGLDFTMPKYSGYCGWKLPLPTPAAT